MGSEGVERMLNWLSIKFCSAVKVCDVSLSIIAICLASYVIAFTIFFTT